MESPIQPIQSPIQKILFGSPGTGKSHRINYEIIPNELGIDESLNPENVIRTVFHPEYTYGDFVGKLVPITKGNNVRYQFYEGHFLRALARAYKNILDQYVDPTKEKDFKDLPAPEKNSRLKKARKEACDNAANVALVIDEINRGNSSAIFGTVFQLLDRDDDDEKDKEKGWSSYKINITELELITILRLIDVQEKLLADNKIEYKFPGESDWVKDYSTFQNRVNGLNLKLKERSIKIPPNLSILATMNTSDNSIYFMDSAFKRRWDWEFVNWDYDPYDDDTQTPAAEYGALHDKEWRELIKNLNEFIKQKHDSIRGIEDKQIGYYFIKPPVPTDKIQNKLMFFLWDSVFNRDKEPLVKLLGVTKNDLVTFGDFTKLHNEFITKINAGEWRKPLNPITGKN